MEQQADLIVRGRLVLPGGEVRDGELVIRDGRIVAVGDPPAPGPRARRSTSGSAWCCPA